MKSEEEGGENRALYESICYNAGPNWRNEYVANLSLTTQVNVNNGNEQWKQTTDSKNVDEVTNATTADVHFVSRFKSHKTKSSSRPSTTCLH